MRVKEILNQFREIASNPAKQKENYLKAGKKVVLTAPVYTPEELIHSMGMVPMGIWGADVEINNAKKYFPAFICSIMQSIVEMGMSGVYEGASAIVIPSLCDSLKVLGENWKYAVPSIPFIPMTYPQNRKPDFGIAFTKAGYKRVIEDLESATGEIFEDKNLADSIRVYNAHNAVMREATKVMAEHPQVSAVERSAVFKSAFFMLKEEHTALVKELLEALKQEENEGRAAKEAEGETDENKAAREVVKTEKIKIVTTGILADSVNLLEIIDEYGLQIAADDVAAESRQYRTDTETAHTALDALAEKFARMDNCSLLYDVEKKRVDMIVEQAKQTGAKGILVILTKFCDPEEFDYPLIKKAGEAAGLPVILIEVDRQMVNYEQARTMIETFRDMMA